MNGRYIANSLMSKLAKNAYKKINFATKIANKNHAPEETLLISPTKALITT